MCYCLEKNNEWRSSFTLSLVRCGNCRRRVTSRHNINIKHEWSIWLSDYLTIWHTKQPSKQGTHIVIHSHTKHARQEDGTEQRRKEECLKLRNWNWFLKSVLWTVMWFIVISKENKGEVELEGIQTRQPPTLPLQQEHQGIGGYRGVYNVLKFLFPARISS